MYALRLLQTSCCPHPSCCVVYDDLVCVLLHSGGGSSDVQQLHSDLEEQCNTRCAHSIRTPVGSNHSLVWDALGLEAALLFLPTGGKMHEQARDVL